MRDKFGFYDLKVGTVFKVKRTGNKYITIEDKNNSYCNECSFFVKEKGACQSPKRLVCTDLTRKQKNDVYYKKI